MKRLMLFVFIVCFGCFLVQPVTAALLTVNIEGLEFLPDDPITLETDVIWSYQLNFSIDGDLSWFNETSVAFNVASNHGHWIEPVPDMFFYTKIWNTNSGINVDDQLVILADVSDAIDGPLLNGNLFTITYPDEVTLSLVFDSFLLNSDGVTAIELLKIPDPAVFGAGDNLLTLQVVPIPPALLLFGSGIIGMLGLRRKFNK